MYLEVVISLINYNRWGRKFSFWVVGDRWAGACFKKEEDALKFYNFIKERENERHRRVD